MNDLYQVLSAALTDKGQKRPHNEDYITFFEPSEKEGLLQSGCLYIVADGVGGAAKGEKASKYAAEKVRYEYFQNPGVKPAERLARAMLTANEDIYNYSQRDGEYKRMATTMVAAVVYQNNLIVANVGDSRAYLIRNGNVKQITRDHNIKGELVREGSLTEEEARFSKVRNSLTRSIGGEAEVTVDVFPPILLEPGDQIFLCSDGLTRYANQETVAKLASQGSPAEIVQAAINYANQSGGADNISAILIQIEQPLFNAQETVRIFKNNTPQPVDWETMVTDPGEINPDEKIFKNKYFPVLIIGFVVLIGGLGLGLWRGWNLLNRNTDNTLESGYELLVTSSPILETVDFDPTEPVTPTATVERIDGEIVISKRITPSNVSKNPVLPKDENSTSEPRDWDCIYMVKEGDYLLMILQKFDEEYQEGITYHYYDGCDSGFTDCGEKLDIPNSKLIFAGRWIDIPISDKDLCESNEGQIYYLSD